MNTQRAGREQAKHLQVLAAVRREIVAGRLSPGSRLPLRSELRKRFNVGQGTLQWALDRLHADGFVQADGRRGAYVCEHPPHLYQYGLVFSGPATGSEPHSRFWGALVEEAQRASGAGPRKIKLYQGVDGHLDNEVYQQLAGDMSAQRLAGVIFGNLNHEALAGTAILEESDVPRVAITHHPELWHIPAVYADMHSFIDRALDHLASAGRKRVAMLVVTDCDAGDLAHFHRGVAARRMVHRPHWLQCVGWPEVRWASHCVQAMLHPGQRERPDGLIVFDDNLVKDTAEGLAAVGASVPGDVAVVAHWNFSPRYSDGLPFRKLGFEARRFLESAMQVIDQQRRGQRGARVTKVAARFEQELSAAGEAAGGARRGRGGGGTAGGPGAPRGNAVS